MVSGHQSRRYRTNQAAQLNSGDGATIQWQRRYEHFCTLAQKVGDFDSVTREGYWQHAEHFCRLLNGSAA